MRLAPARALVGTTEDGERGCGLAEARAGRVADAADARAEDGAGAVEPQPPSASAKAGIASRSRPIPGAPMPLVHLRRARMPRSVARDRALAATAVGRVVYVGRAV